MAMREKAVHRSFGSETEYGYTHKQRRQFATDVGLTILDTLKPSEIKSVNGFLENGSRLYLDLDFVELATAECQTLEELIQNELAGEKIAWETYGNGRSSIRTLHKRTASRNSTFSTGAHENYSTPIEPWHHDGQIQSLAIHFATRTAFSGAGQPTKDGYILGQKMPTISETAGFGQTSKKTLVSLKNTDHHAGSSSLNRLHVTSGDANISPWAIRMKFGTTSLVLRLIEHDIDLSDIFLRDPLAAAHTVAQGIQGMSEPLPLLRSEKTMTALDIQEELAKRSFALSQQIDIPPEEKAVIKDWIATIDALKRYRATAEHPNELNQIDWYAKKQFIDASREKRGQLTIIEEEAIDFTYDKVPDGIGSRLRKSGGCFAPYSPTEGEIETAKKIPPKGRATIRGGVIKRLADKDDLRDINWASIVYDGIRASFGKIEEQYTDDEADAKINEIISRLTILQRKSTT